MSGKDITSEAIKEFATGFLKYIYFFLFWLMACFFIIVIYVHSQEPQHLHCNQPHVRQSAKYMTRVPMVLLQQKMHVITASAGNQLH